MIWRQESVWNCKHSYVYTSIEGILLRLDIKKNETYRKKTNKYADA